MNTGGLGLVVALGRFGLTLVVRGYGHGRNCGH